MCVCARAHQKRKETGVMDSSSSTELNDSVKFLEKKHKNIALGCTFSTVLLIFGSIFP